MQQNSRLSATLWKVLNIPKFGQMVLKMLLIWFHKLKKMLYFCAARMLDMWQETQEKYDHNNHKYIFLKKHKKYQQDFFCSVIELNSFQKKKKEREQIWQRPKLTFPLLSFKAMMFLCFARARIASTVSSIVVNFGTLYNMTGTGLASATFDNKMVKARS